MQCFCTLFNLLQTVLLAFCWQQFQISDFFSALLQGGGVSCGAMHLAQRIVNIRNKYRLPTPKNMNAWPENFFSPTDSLFACVVCINVTERDRKHGKHAAPCGATWKNEKEKWAHKTNTSSGNSELSRKTNKIMHSRQRLALSASCKGY